MPQEMLGGLEVQTPTPATMIPESWLVEFRHPHFKWLDYDQRYATREDAANAMTTKGKAYPLRVRRER